MNKGLVFGIAAVLLLLSMKKKDPVVDSTVDPATGQQLSLQEQWIERIKATPEWYALILQKAQQAGVSVEEQLIHDADWVIAQNWQL